MEKTKPSWEYTSAVLRREKSALGLILSECFEKRLSARELALRLREVEKNLGRLRSSFLS